MNIYIGNLYYGVEENDLREVFEEYGEVESVKIITDRETGKSKGFGFVTMPDTDQANDAIGDLDGSELSGRSMRVSEARDNRSRNNRRF